MASTPEGRAKADADPSPGRAGSATGRVLCLGYSITEQIGYVERARELADSDGVDLAFIKSGWGGHSIHAIAYMIDEILDALACDFVLLELFTGNIRYYDRATLRFYLDQILAATARRNLPIAFLNLYQDGVDYTTEVIAGLLAEYESCLAIPVLDLAREMAGRDANERARLLKDGTHVTSAGADVYGRHVYGFLRQQRSQTGYARYFRTLPRLFVPLKLAAMPDQNCPFELHRNGIALHYAEVPENTVLTIDLGRTTSVRAVMTTYGPTTGTMRFSNPATGRSRDVLLYDRFSYYARSIVMNVNLKSVRTLVLFQHDIVPDIALAKGEKNDGPRKGYVSHVFYRKRLTPAEWFFHHRHRLYWIAQRIRLFLHKTIGGRTGGGFKPFLCAL